MSRNSRMQRLYCKRSFGKTEDVAKIQDLLIFVTKGLATVANEGRKVGIVDKKK